MKHLITIVVLITLAAFAEKSIACTSAIITGKATPDGRPLMWKHRDTGTENNRIIYAQGLKYSYIGLTNSSDLKNEEIWAGTNSAGFCIMNTASYNLKDLNDKTEIKDREGIIMRMALECCATTQDFEHFLDTVTKPMGIETNFGVIDANDGAAYYEVNNFVYEKYDANNPETAPNNYIIRTNYSCSGREDEGMGYIRYENAIHLFTNRETEKFTPEWLLSSASRSYYHSVLNCDLRTTMPKYTIDQDYIPRNSSAASIVFQGVRQGELATRTTMWTLIGFPPCSVVVPLWVQGGEQLPEIMIKTADSNNSPLCDKVVALKNKVFPIKRGNGEKYMNFSLLYNENGTGIIQKIEPYEKEIFEETYKKINEWNTTSWNTKSINDYYEYLNAKIIKIYKDLFDL
ncbi:MAG: carcinine hydrolase/isopenicillin-N N-acyltransferase family protein [Prevotellaceae bacterium]|jgi:hypothetical protein|nr:carcinine hydrolase/isopenicillin-N N-acyltransferase family protein [Prevotellaceae bacterium]